MIAVLNSKDILSVRTDKIYEGVIVCPMKKKDTQQFRIFILNRKRSYTISCDLSASCFSEALKHQSAKTSEALLLRDLIKSINDEYVSTHPPVMWESGEDTLSHYIKNITTQEYFELFW